MRASTTGSMLAAVLALTAAVAPAQHTLTGELPQPAGALPAREVVVVAGATGRTGRLILEQLVKEGRFEVRAMARDPAKARREIGTDYDWVAADVTRPESLVAPLRGATYLVSAVGAGARSGPDGPEFVDYRGVCNLSDAAKAGGVRQFALISSVGAGGGGGFMRWLLNLVGGDVLDWKGKGEACLRASGVPYTIVRPGGLSDDPGGQTGLRLAQGDEQFGRISRADTAAVMVATLGNPDAIGKTFEVVSDEHEPPNAWRGQFAALSSDAPP